MSFLSTSREGRPLYFSTSYVQSFFIFEGNDLLAAAQGEPESSLSERIESMSLPDLWRAIEQRRVIYRRGKGHFVVRQYHEH